VSLLIIVLLLAAANGANDTFKAVATLWGSGVVSFKAALSWGALTTLCGSLLSLLVASSLVARFGGKGLVDASSVSDPRFVLAVATGALVTVALACLLGLPISTTHALIGGLVGAGVARGGVAGVTYAALGSTYLLPLLLSPFLAATLAAALVAGISRMRGTDSLDDPQCLCVASNSLVAAKTGVGLASSSELIVAPVETCRNTPATALVSVEPRRMLDRAHVLFGGAVGFARGLNDTPKIFGLVAVLPLVPETTGRMTLLMIAVAMMLGGLFGSARVARRLSFEVASLEPVSATATSVVTASLVTAASLFGWPVSTTHVSCGALIGTGAASRTAIWSTIWTIVLGWAATLPLAALLAAATFAMIGNVVTD
jgi:PiT family inorganic phosphate transporter